MIKTIFLLLAIINICLGKEEVEERDAWYCSGTEIVAARSGIITDHRGAETYERNRNCWWVIRPETADEFDGITFVFDKLDTEYYYDFVRISSSLSPSEGEVEEYFFGNTLPTRPIFVDGPEAYVLWHSDQLIVGRGFEMRYFISTCPNRCSNNGVCINDVCECDEGFSGEDCSASFCPPSCGQEGSSGHCDGNRCVCDAGYYGGDCTDRFCTDEVTEFNGWSGAIRDHQGGGDYLNNLNCRWLISPTPAGDNKAADAIELTFSAFDLENEYDFVRIYDGINEEAPLIAQLTGHALPRGGVTARSGAMFVLFETDQALVRTGFAASYTAATCPGNKCSGHGRCVSDGTCHCDIGFRGDACEDVYCANECSGHGECVQSPVGDSERCDCHHGWKGIDCGVCYDAECPAECSGVEEIFAASGTISSGADEYGADTLCSWVVYLPSDRHLDSVTVTFEQFWLEEDAYVSIYEGERLTLAHLVAQLGATDDPDIMPAAIELSAAAGSFTIVFEAGANAEDAPGFIAHWQAYTCDGRSCSGNGDCLQGTCQCEAGFGGNWCEHTICENDCSGYGTCLSTNPGTSSETCACTVGHYGVACDSGFCEGHVVASSLPTFETGVIEDHVDGAAYRPDSDCEWILTTQDSGSITLWFDKFQTEAFYDRVTIYDGYDTDAPVLLSASGSRKPYPLVASGPVVLVTFKTDLELQLQGFTLMYEGNRRCSGGCSGYGYCMNGVCHCFGGRGGSSCGVMIDDVAELVADGEAVRGEVSEFGWQYYILQVEVNAHTNEAEEYDIDLEVTLPESMPILFARYNQFPTLNAFDFVDPNVDWDNQHRLHIRQPHAGSLYVGIYGYTLDTYSLVVHKVEDSIPPDETPAPPPADDFDSDNWSPEKDSHLVMDVLIGVFVTAFLIAAIVWAVVWYRSRNQPPPHLYQPPVDDIESADVLDDILIGGSNSHLPTPGESLIDSDNDDGDGDDSD